MMLLIFYKLVTVGYFRFVFEFLVLYIYKLFSV